GYYDAYYNKARKFRGLIKNDFDKAFEKYDCLITPVSPTTAYKLGEKMDDPLQMYLSDIYTISINLAGIPGLTIPYGKSPEGLPIGFQILGKHFNETAILKLGNFIENNC
ncbi:Asp-tRNA(Asn)/Glu-tRNA(Gln) amidotransferase subunit GatA, partial [bacterium]|nr:Asp-tRNA(Asn)/Glu-tRNA(Gln) amidotransferase subunit GatA [bacterium]